MCQGHSSLTNPSELTSPQRSPSLFGMLLVLIYYSARLFDVHVRQFNTYNSEHFSNQSTVMNMAFFMHLSSSIFNHLCSLLNSFLPYYQNPHSSLSILSSNFFFFKLSGKQRMQCIQV